MKRLVPACAALAVVFVTANFHAQSPMPFKLGTFEQGGKPFVGVIVKDSIVIDLAQANTALKSPAAKVPAPSDMKDLIARYDTGVRARIGEILQNTKPLEGAGRPALRSRSEEPEDAAAHHVSDDDAERGGELSGARGRDGRRAPRGRAAPAPGDALPGTTSAPGIWERKPDDKRWNPYMFLKSPTPS